MPQPGPRAAPSGPGVPPEPLDRVRQLERRLAEAEQAVRARDDLLSIAAHELRTPLNALSLQIAAIERRARQDASPRLAEDLRRAERLLQRYVRRATVLLDVTRLTSGHFAIVRSLCPLEPLVRGVLEAHAEEAALAGTLLTSEIDSGLVGHWDPQAIEQVIANLVSNGIKHGGGAPVTVQAARHGDAEVRIVVADRGPGVAPAVRDRVFGKFERAMDGGPVRTGFGLGLWIARQLVLVHGGSVELTEREGGGAAFSVTLPLVGHPLPPAITPST